MPANTRLNPNRDPPTGPASVVSELLNPSPTATDLERRMDVMERSIRSLATTFQNQAHGVRQQIQAQFDELRDRLRRLVPSIEGPSPRVENPPYVRRNPQEKHEGNSSNCSYIFNHSPGIQQIASPIPYPQVTPELVLEYYGTYQNVRVVDVVEEEEMNNEGKIISNMDVGFYINEELTPNTPRERHEVEAHFEEEFEFKTEVEVKGVSSLIEPKSRNSLNALIESFAKFSEPSASLSSGDDIGMNLLSSVAAGEMSSAAGLVSVSPTVTPAGSPKQEPCTANDEAKSTILCEPGMAQGFGQSEENPDSDSVKSLLASEKLNDISKIEVKSSAVEDALKVDLANEPAIDESKPADPTCEKTADGTIVVIFDPGGGEDEATWADTGGWTMEDSESGVPASKKRVAGRQISKENPELDEDGPEPEMGSFKRASDEVWAASKIVKVRRAEPSPAASNPFAALCMVPPSDPNSSILGDKVEVGVDEKHGQIEEGKKEDESGTSVDKSNGVEEKEKKVEEKEISTAKNEDKFEDGAVVAEEIVENGDKRSVEEVKEEAAKEDVKETKENEKEKVGTDDKDTEVKPAVPLSSFQQLSSSQNAFTGLAGSGFGSSSFSFVTVANEGSIFSASPGSSFGLKSDNPSFSLFGDVGSSNGNLSVQPPSTSAPSMQEVPTETGEENEKAVFTADAILYEYLGSVWKERGKGELKLNISLSGTKKARLVMRTRGNYRLVLDASLYPDMVLTNMEKKGITFACVNSAGAAADADEDGVLRQGANLVIKLLKSEGNQEFSNF